MNVFLERWKHEQRQGKLPRRLKKILINVQICRNNGLNTGRPVDGTEKFSLKPVINDCTREMNPVESDEDDMMDETIDESLIAESMTTKHDNVFHDGDGHFQCQSFFTRCHGSHMCRKSLIVSPMVDNNKNVVVIQTPERKVNELDETGQDIAMNNQNKILHVEDLNVLAVKFFRRIIGKNRCPIDIEVNGTLENVRTFADFHFPNDKYQKKAFEFIICAFIDQLINRLKEM
ncbi:hypothetical protein IV203_029167 [Nitzschia inconspicua]|uniref:Uncharacterized protein n=1 Tax=Nitzschia inconspicua TaxID=303405 RepID=A0A9K3LQX5_9STRA|nr:hypothetical protein IV203_029167 [Nitzschia inconspicua]